MLPQPIDTGWGFNAVIDLIESDYDAASPTLSVASPVKTTVGTPDLKSASGPIAQPSLDTHIPRLGDFTKLFDELGISRPEPLAPASPLDSEGPFSSDDALTNGQADAASIGDPDSPLAGMTVKEQKKERKKAAKKERKEARRALKASLAPEALTSNYQPTNQPRTRSNVGAKIRPATPIPHEAQSQAVKPQPPTRVSNFPVNSTDPASIRVPQRLSSLAQPFTPSNGPFTHPGPPIDGPIKFSVTQAQSRPSLHEAQESYGLQPQVPPSYQPLDLSFDTLALLMERRRPVAKRIYASSQREANPLPHVTKLAATSKAVGYENLIQEQVFIRREDSDRKKFFKDVERLGWTKATQLRSGSGSDSETGPAAPATLSAPKWVEQGVDEILHLKMCQSVLDTEVPTTMVLATGDGNAAEHSDGFLANVERALKKGWVVELVSWKQQMSAGYKNKKFRAKWGEKFKVIQLDDYLESLIETQ
ncbi:hypothetical protein SLS60_008697 [Paraconiothyrium brasiliense]|uniref:NYN domain-containing protein n=1 Tax=Paraconiothyrium brasiliense TaxID=300254 RepID=A0ABR3QY78_9PLEO